MDLPFRREFDPHTFNFEELPAGHGVFLLETGGEPYLNKSAHLRRRISRLLEEGQDGKRLNLRATARAICWQPAGSVFEANVLLWRLARRCFPDSYRQRLRLRPPVLLKLNLENAYPRCYPTRRLAKEGVHFGPFPSRATAERFASDFLDLFLIRRCVEEIRPDPAHPGCVYGEMGMCLRPCQAVVTQDVYVEEVGRVREFLATEGRSLLRRLEEDRARASADLNYEEAGRIHKRLEKVQAVLSQPELAWKAGLATDLDRLNGIVVQPSAAPQTVELFPVYRGFLLRPVSLSLAIDPETGQPVSLDARLREALAGLALKPSGRRTEHLALLSRWFYRGTRKGEFVGFEGYEKLPYRRLVNAIGRVAKGAGPPGEAG
jgi:excinuclease UvrABC nuclease subunit